MGFFFFLGYSFSFKLGLKDFRKAGSTGLLGVAVGDASSEPCLYECSFAAAIRLWREGSDAERLLRRRAPRGTEVPAAGAVDPGLFAV